MEVGKRVGRSSPRWSTGNAVGSSNQHGMNQPVPKSANGDTVQMASHWALGERVMLPDQTVVQCPQVPTCVPPVRVPADSPPSKEKTERHGTNAVWQQVAAFATLLDGAGSTSVLELTPSWCGTPFTFGRLHPCDAPTTSEASRSAEPRASNNLGVTCDPLIPSPPASCAVFVACGSTAPDCSRLLLPVLRQARRVLATTGHDSTSLGRPRRHHQSNERLVWYAERVDASTLG